MEVHCSFIKWEGILMDFTPSPPTNPYLIYMEEFFIHFLPISRASKVTDSLASRTGSVETSISYNKISGWSS